MREVWEKCPRRVNGHDFERVQNELKKKESEALRAATISTKVFLPPPIFNKSSIIDRNKQRRKIGRNMLSTENETKAEYVRLAQYELREELGSGQYGVVRQVRCQQTSKDYAMKIIR